MARQTGIITITGTIGNLTFYKSQDGNMVREKSHISKDRFMNDPAFVRSRENSYEFGEANRCSKLIFDSVRSFRKAACDNRAHSRLVQVMREILPEDRLSVRGKRSPAAGIQQPEGKILLQHFNFNKDAILSKVLLHPYVLTDSGEFMLQGLVPLLHIKAPAGATHVRLSTACSATDFAESAAEVTYSEELTFALDLNPMDASLTAVPALKTGATCLYFLKLEFYQDINGTAYALQNANYNVLELIKVF